MEDGRWGSGWPDGRWRCGDLENRETFENDVKAEAEELRAKSTVPSGVTDASCASPLALRPWRLALPPWLLALGSSLLAVLPFAFLWFILINQLRVEWRVNPQYGYGWAVPILCLGLLWKRWPEVSAVSGQWPLVRCQRSVVRRPWSVALLLFALLWLPTRLIQEANPEWRLVSRLLAIEVVGLTLLTIRFAFGSGPVARLAFPICFFLVAVPWPTIVEGPLIQELSRANGAMAVEALGWLGIPALQHENVIEVGAGLVGIDEACSGIRSFQSSLMISLFLGELYRLTVFRRAALCLAGFFLAYLFNFARTLILVSVAARNGLAAISQWHDPAGVGITVACLLSLWLLGLALGKPGDHGTTGPRDDGTTDSTGNATTESRGPRSVVGGPAIGRAIGRFGLALLVWLLSVEIAVEGWYREHEHGLPTSAGWTIELPRENATFRELPIPENARRLLRYDEGLNTTWQEGDVGWQVIFLRWLPGRIGVQVAKSHTPEVCLTAAGKRLVSASELKQFPAGNLVLPFRTYVVEESGRPVHVFYCLWEDRAEGQSFKTERLTYGNRLAPVRAGRRNLGQRSLEVAVRGYEDPRNAEAAVVRQLERLVRAERPSRD